MVEAYGHAQVRGAERLLPDGQGALVERLGLGIPALIRGRARPDCGGWWRRPECMGPSVCSRIARAR